MGAFNQKEVALLLEQYAQTGSREDLGRVVEAAEGLIWSCIRRQGIYTEPEDCAQRCRVALVNVVPGYQLERGSPFGFFWTVISNTCRKHLRFVSRYAGKEVCLTEAVGRPTQPTQESYRAVEALEQGRLIEAQLQLGHVPKAVTRFVKIFVCG